MVDFAVSDPAAARATLDRIVRCIRGVVDPELIVLFGSRAWGGARDDSDYDLMVVLPDEATFGPSRLAVHSRLVQDHISADVIARTPAQYERNQRDPGLLDFVIARQGRVLYATGRVPQRSVLTQRISEAPPGEGLAMWIRRAGSDLQAAEQLLAAPDPTWDAICFHAHASTEKLLKAMVVNAGTYPPRTHDLGALLALQPPAVRENAAMVAACTLLMSLLPNARYPELPEPTPDEGRRALAAARQVRDVIAGRLVRKR